MTSIPALQTLMVIRQWCFEMTIQKIDIKDDLGNRVSGILSIPKNASKVVIFSHGFTSSKNSKTYKEFQRELNLLGIGTLRYDYYGHGPNYPNRYGVSEDTTLSKTVASLRAMIKYVRQKGKYKIILFGSSFGGLVSIVVTLQDRKIDSLILKSSVIDPVDFWRQRIKESFGNSGLELWKTENKLHYKDDFEEFELNWSFWEDLKRYDILNSVKKIRCSTLIIHGDKDRVVSISQSKKLASIMGVKLRIIKGADHAYSNKKHYDEMKKTVIDFIIKNGD
jgi:uncharacterized protein